MATSRKLGLYELLIEAELQQYYSGLKNELKVQNVPQLKYVTDEDLYSIGMAKPEVRRLKKFFQKHYPQTYLSKFKKLILSKKEENGDPVLSISSELPEKPAIKVPNKYMISAENIIVNKELGQGEFGVVQQGVWTDEDARIQVAIKCLSRERMLNNPMEFLKEAAIMHSIDHEHIVRLHGVVFDTNSLMLVTELAPLRSLLECLKEPSLRSSFPILSLCDFAVQICDGMQYLEQKRLIHRDLAARNILVFSKNKVKISDFGLSRALGVGKDYYQTNFNVNLKLPIAWCAPECISYLRFTSASDVWAYGVTLWEMFSYGFQPWAALTGQQILEAIDEPNCQRLEQPECSPKEYYALMLKCWYHDPNKRPTFSDLMNILPDCKPELVQAIQEYFEEPGKSRRDQLVYRVGDVITVLDKQQNTNCWKGALQNGKTGLFNPTHTVTYLGNNLPSSKSELARGDGRNTYSSRRKLRTDMISGPQGELKHMGHVGLDGAYFGDLSFLGGKTPSLPRQVVAPYKPHEDAVDMARNGSDSDSTPLLKKNQSEETTYADNTVDPTLNHEYLEISDSSRSPSPTPSPRPSFDYGPSLLDEMAPMLSRLHSQRKGSVGSKKPHPLPLVGTSGAIGNGASPPASPAEAINVRNELKEMAAKAKGGKLKAAIKPISQAEAKTLDSAIAMAAELATRSLTNDIDGCTPPESPHTPNTPNKRKFSFRFPSQKSNQKNGSKNYSEQVVSDIQSVITPEARQVYSSLIEQPILDSSGILTLPAPLYGRQPISNFKTFGVSSSSTTEMNPLKMVRAGVVPVVRTKPRAHSASEATNPIPLPPRDRTRLTLDDRPRHRRRHPLVIPAGIEDPAISPCSDDNNDVFLPSPTSLCSVEGQQLKSLDSGDLFEEQIATELDALDALEGNSPRAEHVSCEDLLAFSTQPQSKSRGLDSDEARIILKVIYNLTKEKKNTSERVKVLGREVSSEECLGALDMTNWEVHGAIKLLRLMNVLKQSGQQVDLGECWNILGSAQGNVEKAANLIIARESSPDFV